MVSEIKNANQYLHQGKIILYPTDTVWGIGCDATDKDAVFKIYKLKNRVESKSLIVLVSSLSMLKKHVLVSKEAMQVLKTVKKPTTIIYNNPKGFAKNTIAKDNTIAIRIVQDDFCKKLIKRFGKPIVSTSANISGELTPKSFSEVSQPIIEGVDYIVDLYKDKINNNPSSIVRINGDKVEFLRP